MGKTKKKIKVSRVVLVISALILITLIVLFFVQNSQKERPVSPREQYQMELKDKD